MEAFDGLAWDERKRLTNLQKHDLDFIDALQVFRGPCMTAAAKTVKGEARGVAVGVLGDVHVAVVYTTRGSVLRLISMRRASAAERRRYAEVFDR